MIINAFWEECEIIRLSRQHVGTNNYVHVSCLFQDRTHSLSTFYSTVEGATKLKFAPFCSP